MTPKSQATKEKKYTSQTSSKLKKNLLYFKGHYKESEKSTEWEKNICKLYQN